VPVRERGEGRLDHPILLQERRAASLPQDRLQGQGLSKMLAGLDALGALAEANL